MLRTRESAQKDPYRAGRSLPQASRMRKRGRGLAGPQNGRNERGIARTAFDGLSRADLVPDSLLKCRGPGVYSIFAWGRFRDFRPGPKGSMGAGQDHEVAAATVNGLLLRGRSPVATGSR